MREPSIHITISNLKILIKEYDTALTDKELEGLVKFIALKGKTRSLSHRSSLEVSNKRVEKKLNNTLKFSSKSDSLLFASTLIKIRTKMKHRGINLIKESSKDWEFIRQASELAYNFCKDFELDKREGFKIYIEEALKMMSRFNLRQINSKHDQICERYEAITRMDDDPNKILTEKAYDTYIGRVYSKTGMAPKYKENQPDKYLYFIKVGEICKELGISPVHFVNGNFESLSWTNSIPMPEQLVTENATNRVIKWAAENNIILQDKNKNENKSKLGSLLKQVRK